MIILALVLTFWDGESLQKVHISQYERSDCYKLAAILNAYSDVNAGWNCVVIE